MSPVLPLIVFGVVLILILVGYPVAFTIGGVSIIIGIFIFDTQFFYLLSLRIYGTMQNFVLLAVPLFIFMGLILEKTGIATDLLHAMSGIFRRVRGGMAIAVVLVGALLAASTGIVGATVITMGLISLPALLKSGYSARISTGVIASSGTLGQIIPPSVVLVLLGSVLNVSVGDLFLAALIPSSMMIGCYILYIFIYGKMFPNKIPQFDTHPKDNIIHNEKVDFATFLYPLLLIFLVLGSIFFGIASPTEAAGVGAFGALALALKNKSLNITILKKVLQETTKLTSMVFMILVGAIAFSLVFRGLEGDKFLLSFIQDAHLEPLHFIVLVMILVFIAGFFIDFIEIIFIIVPVVAPIFISMDINLIWIGILLAINLQTSFLTPPFGFALFYLKGVAPPEVKTLDIYKGVIPFICIQIFILFIIVLFPEILFLSL